MRSTKFVPSASNITEWEGQVVSNTHISTILRKMRWYERATSCQLDHKKKGHRKAERKR